ncbi:hypothetical protein [Ekhidna sp. To15]|uniref:hypothetical protein n=1 Tax=Ekhidna sp. To15 TaxID=3395267 RepID=UPI003F51C716
MNRYLFFFVLFLIFRCASAQDLIVTSEGDSIDCKITRITGEFIHFSVIDKSGVLLMRSRLPLSKVEYYEQSTTPTENKPSNPERSPEDRVTIEYFEPSKFRLSMTTGYTYQLGGYEGLPSSYKSQVQSLWNFGSELNYFVNDNLGIGAKYSYIYTKANEDFVSPFNTAFGFSSLTDEKIRFNYIGMSLMFRNFSSDDQVLNYLLSVGMIKYRTDGFGDGVPFYQDGNTIGFILGVSYDFILMKSFGVGFGAELNIARMSEFDNNGTVVLADFNLTRFDFTIGIRLFQ